jgi:hypothetical protein
MRVSTPRIPSAGRWSALRGGSRALYRLVAAVTAAALLPVVLLAPPAQAARVPEVKVDQAYICWELGPKPPTGLAGAKLTGATVGAIRSNSCNVPIRLSMPSRDKVVVLYRTAPITAKPGEDYIEVDRAELVIDPGETVGYTSIPIVSDCEKEEDETFAVELLDAYGAVIAEKVATVTIVDLPEGC